MAALKTSWTTEHEGSHHYCDVGNGEVIVGNHYGSAQSDNAGAVSYAEFLAGNFQGLVRSVYGEAVLAEVIAAVRSLSG